MTTPKNIPADGGSAINVSSAELFEKAMKLKRESDNFNYNTKAQAQYEQMMDEATKLQMKGR